MKKGMDDRLYEIQHAMDDKITTRFAYELEIGDLELRLRTRTILLIGIFIVGVFILIISAIDARRSVRAAYESGYEAGYDDGINSDYHRSYVNE